MSQNQGNQAGGRKRVTNWLISAFIFAIYTTFVLKYWKVSFLGLMVLALSSYIIAASVADFIHGKPLVSLIPAVLMLAVVSLIIVIAPF